MERPAIRIGVIGYGHQDFDQEAARQHIGRELRRVFRRHLGRKIELVSTYHDSGVARIAYELAEKLDMITVGFAPREVLETGQALYRVKKVILQGKQKGEAAHELVRYVHGLIRVGGDADCRRTVRLFRTLHQHRPLKRMLREYEVDAWGDDGPPPSLPPIRGLQYIEQFLDNRQQQALIHCIDQQAWARQAERRVQHYGYGYDYQGAPRTETLIADQLPSWSIPLTAMMLEEGLMPGEPNQLVVNEYLPGQGIDEHVDNEDLFGDTIVSVSLGGPTVMNFAHTEDGAFLSLPLEPQSALVLQHSARYEWAHGISPRQEDYIDGVRQSRGRRLSLTFRKVVLDE